jgi:hypothetical protein
VVDENAAHHSCGESQKVRPGDESRPALRREAHVRLVNQGGRLESVIASLAGEEPAGEAPKLVVNGGQKLRKRLPRFRVGLGEKGFDFPFGQVGYVLRSFPLFTVFLEGYPIPRPMIAFPAVLRVLDQEAL